MWSCQRIDVCDSVRLLYVLTYLEEGARLDREALAAVEGDERAHVRAFRHAVPPAARALLEAGDDAARAVDELELGQVLGEQALRAHLG